MREILFRAKRIDDGKWIDGDLTRCVVVGETHIRRIEENLSTTTHRVDPETVCQYTGLTDKNGRKIFEGDIVSGVFDGGRIIGFIKYGSNAGYYIERIGLYGILLDNAQDWLEIVGNIYDNPELAEGDVE